MARQPDPGEIQEAHRTAVLYRLVVAKPVAIGAGGRGYRTRIEQPVQLNRTPAYAGKTLSRGLQTSIHRFESGRRLHSLNTDGPAERSAGLRLTWILRPSINVGLIPR